MGSRCLAEIETDLLAKVLNFSSTSKTLPDKDIVATIEDSVKDLETEEAAAVCGKIILTSIPANDNLSKWVQSCERVTVWHIGCSFTGWQS